MFVTKRRIIFLKKGITFAIFSITGKVLVERERFIIKDIGLLSSF